MGGDPRRGVVACRMVSGTMRRPEEITADIERVAREIEETDHVRDLLAAQLAELMRQARDHPALTIEEARQAPERPISRVRAYELARSAD